MNTGLPFSEACERNRDPILKALTTVLPTRGQVLEIGSCTGQHVVHFARFFPELTWHPSDRAEHLEGLLARLRQEGSSNVLEAVELDVRERWPAQRFEAVYSSNTAHIMNWESVTAMFKGVGENLLPGGVFCLYGPFNEEGQFTSHSNEVFDSGLRARDPEMGIRDREALEFLAQQHQMKLQQQFRLPANNSLLVFRKNKGLPDV